MKKKLWIAVYVAGWVLFIVFILWSFGWKALERKARRDYLRGVNDAVSQVINQAKQGKVIINMGNEQLVLIPVNPTPPGADPNGGT